MIRFRMLGTLDLTDSQGREVRSLLRSPKLLALLGYLAIARPHGYHRRDTLVALLWPELDHLHARSALRQAVYTLREALGNGVLLGRGEDELAIDPERLCCDVRTLEEALAAGDAERALDLYGGELLNGLHLPDVPEFERWLDGEREHIRQRACEAARLLTDREDAAGNPAGAGRWARRLSELSPADETAVGRLIQLLDRSGDRAGAVRAYEEFERRLARDLELEPSGVTASLVEAVRTRKQVVEAVATVVGEALPNGDRAPLAPATGPTQDRGLMARRAPTAKRIAAVLALAAVGTAAGGWLVLARDAEPSAAAAHTTKRLVVLPFTNLGPAEDAYFTTGVTEELTARLAVVDSLRVIGSTSAQRYKNTNLSIPQIGKALGVDYILEGSVRWEKSPRGQVRVRVTPQLVSTADGTHLWAQIYDQPVNEIFRVQSDIARKVVQALDLTLLEPQRRAVESAPTANLEAYQSYRRGNDFLLRRGTEERPTRAALQMYEKAVKLDPDFALAYTMLSRAHSRMYAMFYDHSVERRAMAKRAVDRAFELEPDLPEAHHALGTYYAGGLEFDRALQEFALVEARRPNETNIFMAKATTLVRVGKLREALVEYEKARQLDPASSNVASNYGHPYELLRDFPRAEAMFDRAISLAPDRPYPYFYKAWLYLRWDGDTRRARAALNQAREAGIAEEPSLFHTRVLVEMVDGRYQEAISLLSGAPAIVISDQHRIVLRARLYAQIYGLLHRRDLELAYYDSAQSILSRMVQDRPGDPRLHGALGIVYAGLGRKQQAIEEGRKGVDLLPIRNDAYRGYTRLWELARIYAMVGEYDAAADGLEYLLSIPGDLTVAWLRIDPTFAPLRGNARFEQLMGRGK